MSFRVKRLGRLKTSVRPSYQHGSPLQRPSQERRAGEKQHHCGDYEDRQGQVAPDGCERVEARPYTRAVADRDDQQHGEAEATGAIPQRGDGLASRAVASHFVGRRGGRDDDEEPCGRSLERAVEDEDHHCEREREAHPKRTPDEASPPRGPREVEPTPRGRRRMNSID